MFFNCCRRCCCRSNNSQEKNCWDKCDKHDKCDNRDDKFDNCHNQNNRHNEQYNRFDGQGYYWEYNNLGYFNLQNNCGCDKDYDRKNCKKEDNYHGQDFDKNCYTPSWDNDRDCNYDNNKHDKCEQPYNKYCRPVKYICIPFDKF